MEVGLEHGLVWIEEVQQLQQQAQIVRRLSSSRGGRERVVGMHAGDGVNQPYCYLRYNDLTLDD